MAYEVTTAILTTSHSVVVSRKRNSRLSPEFNGCFVLLDVLVRAASNGS
jgi:hypothetical protein